MKSPVTSVEFISADSVAPRRGMVLVIVMIVIVIVSLAGFSFAALMFTERKAVSLHGEELQVAAAVDSGEELIKSIVGQPPSQRESGGGIDDNPEMFRAVSLVSGDESTRQPIFSVVSPRTEDDEVVGVRYGLEDESNKLNLAVLEAWDKRQPGSGRRALMNLPGMTESAADSILDWIDADGQPRSQGAEDDYYAGLDPSYKPRNGLPQSLEELLLVKDVTREMLFGDDTDRNFRVDEYESQSSDNSAKNSKLASPRGTRPWQSYLTLYSAEANTSRQGRQRINLNDTNLQKLQQSLNVALDPQASKFIIAYRQFGAYKGSESASSADAYTSDLSKPAKFRLASIFDLVGARVAIPSSSPQKPATILNSPFHNDRQSMHSALPKLLDLTTVSPLPVIVGRVNVNLAPRVVLSGIPGIDDALAEQIVSARQAHRGQEDVRSSAAAWLLIEGFVDLAKMKAIEPYVTGAGDVYRAQIVGLFTGSDRSPTSRVELIVDATTSQPRRLCRGDLRMLGRGFSLAELDADGNSMLSTTQPAQHRDRQPASQISERP